jgi:hypothetical protein
MYGKLISFRKNRFELSLIFVLGISWIPLLRFGFDSHHDGLITSTLNNLSLGSSGVGNWPFNQYGPAWFIILKLFSYITSSQYFFLTTRAVTLVFYFIAFFFTFLVAKRFLSKRLSLFSVLVLMLIQPFVSDYNSDMIPWPSALSMAMIPIATWSCLRAIDSRTIRTKYLNLIVTSGSIVLITFSRVQIGIALLLALVFVLVVYQKTKEVFALITSSILLFGGCAAYLIQMDWISDVTIDVFKFGSLYVTGDKSTLPKPFWTLAISLAFVAAIELLRNPKIHSNPLLRRKIVILPLFGVVTLVATLILRERGLNLVQLTSVAFRRFWISLIIASLIVILINLLRSWIWNRKLPSLDFVLLFVFSGVAELQVWPLFDQMHAWWASTPAVILVVLLISRHQAIATLSAQSQRVLVAISGISIICVYVITFASSVSHARIPLNVVGYSGVLISEKDGAEIEGVDRFLNEALKEGNSVLNLCTNGNPFFSPSASRAFVFWTPMTMIDSLERSIYDAQPDQVVTCSFVTNPVFYPEYRDQQEEILEMFKYKFDQGLKYKSPNGVTWRVYSRNN